MNPFNIASALLSDLATTTKKADKDALLASLASVAKDAQVYDTTGMDEFSRRFCGDVASRMAAALGG